MNESYSEKLNKNKQILYLVPEISITSQMILRLQNRFGNRVIVYHSKYSNNERVEMWKLINENNKKEFFNLISKEILKEIKTMGLLIECSKDGGYYFASENYLDAKAKEKCWDFFPHKEFRAKIQMKIQVKI